MRTLGNLLHASIPNILTSCCAISGFFAIWCACSRKIAVASLLILVSLVLDRLDGPLARRWGIVSSFGGRLDAHADALSFCAAPAALLLALSVEVREADVVVAVIYLVCGLWRLANLAPPETSTEGPILMGLPTAASACLILNLGAILPFVPVNLGSLMLLTTPVICGGLMLSSLVYPKNGMLTNLLQVITPAAVISIWMNR